MTAFLALIICTSFMTLVGSLLYLMFNWVREDSKVERQDDAIYWRE